MKLVLFTRFTRVLPQGFLGPVALSPERNAFNRTWNKKNMIKTTRVLPSMASRVANVIVHHYSAKTTATPPKLRMSQLQWRRILRHWVFFWGGGCWSGWFHDAKGFILGLYIESNWVSGMLDTLEIEIILSIMSVIYLSYHGVQPGDMTRSRDSPPLQYHRAPYQPTMGAPPHRRPWRCSCGQPIARCQKPQMNVKQQPSERPNRWGLSTRATYVVYFCTRQKKDADILEVGEVCFFCFSLCGLLSYYLKNSYLTSSILQL